MDQGAILELAAHGRQPRLEMRPHVAEGRRVGALEAVDRLFRIADGKQGAPAPLHPLAGEKLGDQPRDLLVSVPGGDRPGG